MGLLKAPDSSFAAREPGAAGANDFDKAKIGGLYKTNADVGAGIHTYRQVVVDPVAVRQEG